MASNIKVIFLPVDKQTNGFNCGLFALAYASILLVGKSLIDAGFVVNEMCSYFMKCLKAAYLYPSPTLEKAVDVIDVVDGLNFSCFDSKMYFSFYNLIKGLI